MPDVVGCSAELQVPALCNMLGPDLNKFSGMSKRVDSALKDLQDKISSADGEIVS